MYKKQYKTYTKNVHIETLYKICIMILERVVHNMRDKELDKKIYRLLQSGWNELTKEQQESVIRFSKILYETQGLPVEQQQEIIDNIQDENILKFLEQEKNKLS